MIFSGGLYSKNYNFYFKNVKLDLVSEYKYLGIYLSKSGSFLNCKKHLAEQANRALFSLLKKTRILHLPIDIQIELFNKTIRPILLYAYEIWGVGNLDIIEKVELQFLKLIFNLKKSTPSFMVYGEVGANPITLVGCFFGLNNPLRQYFSLYRVVSQREGERRERIDESKNVQTTPTRTYCKSSRPLPYSNTNK